MSDFKACPGIRKLVRPVPEYFKCSNCGGDVEIWSDENSGVCDTCSRESTRPQEQSCLDWCEHADKCRDYVKSIKR